MKIKELEKEGWVRFGCCEDKNKEISEKELCQLVLESYRNNKKYNREKIHPKLQERYDNLDNILRPLKNITSVIYIKDGKLESRRCSNEYNDFIMVIVDKEIEILLNISTGEDLSIYHTTNVEITKNISQTKELYSFNKNDFQDDLNISKIESVILYKNIDIVNSLSNTEINDSDFIEIKDIKGNVFYIDILFNNIYKRNNAYHLKKNKKTKEFMVFKIKENNIFDIKKFDNKMFNFFKNFYELDD